MPRFGWSGPKIYDLPGTWKRFPPDLKSILIHLNILMDYILFKIGGQRYNGCSLNGLNQISTFEHFVLLLEDRRFFRHFGIDIWCVPRVLKMLVTFKSVRGVTTIEQQLIRTVLRHRERTISRKAQELFLGWALTYRITKRDILRAYLSMAYFGYRLRGCDRAALDVFSLRASELNEVQSAFIASLLVYPLPKPVQQLAAEKGLHPVQDVAAYVDASRAVAPIWANRIMRRFSYGITLFNEAKKTV
jgi:membrane carboxypeptidase/penicillin-binding protein PbpC